MPIPGVSELATVARLAWTVHNLGSSKYTNAQQEFTEFITDVATLGKTLDAINVAAAAPGPANNVLDLHSEFVQSIIIEARETLSSCQKLIDNNASFKKDRAGFVTNILWHLTIAQHVERHQTRIQVCFQKANFVLDIQANGSILWNQELAQEDARADHEETHRLLRGLLGMQNAPNNEYDATELLSARVSGRFEESLMAMIPNQRPTVAQHVDAVWIFYDKSTHSFEPQRPLVLQPLPLHYLNLLKCIWVLHYIQGDDSFVNYYSKPFSAAWIRNLTRKVKRQATRFLQGSEGIQPVSEMDLLNLSDTDFCIDPRQNPCDLSSNPYEANAGEELLMRKTLQVQDQRTVQEFLVFRIAESRLRLRKTTSTKGAPPHIHESELDGRLAHFNPIYALTHNALPSITWKATTSDQSGQEVTFTSLNDAREFQRYVTNFRIACDETELVSVRKKCGWDGSGKNIGGRGRVQVWAHESPTPSVLSNGGSRHSSLSHRSSQVGSIGQSTNTWPPSAFDGDRPPSTVRNDGKNWVLTPPVCPQLVLLTEDGGIKRLISIAIDEYTQTAPDKCHCSKTNNRCREIIIERSDGGFLSKKLQTRQYDTNAHSDGWNVAILGEPKHGEAAKMDKDDVKYVSIQLGSVECRERLEKKINTACAIIRNKVDEFHKYMKDTKNIAIVQNE